MSRLLGRALVHSVGYRVTKRMWEEDETKDVELILKNEVNWRHNGEV